MTKTEPAAVATVIAALINGIVLIFLKEELTGDVQAAIVTVITFIAGLWTRSQVTPVPPA
jgi:hypothetical protein